MRWVILAVFLAAAPAWAEIIVPTRTIRAKEIITAEDLTSKSAQVPGAFSDPWEIVGQEARAALYPGRPIRPGDIGPPAIVDRNDTVLLIFNRGGLEIIAEGRALGRGGAGDIVRVMNTSSRMTVSGTIRNDGAIEVR